MSDRTVEDRLREEYFTVLPAIQRATLQLEAEIRYHTRSILNSLALQEQLVVRARSKDCESSINKLKRKQNTPGRVFDPNPTIPYTLLSLSDLAGVRVLAFPNYRVEEINKVLRAHYPDWDNDPVLGKDDNLLAYKYRNHFQVGRYRIPVEYQIVPMLIGLFWDVEHAALYKSGTAILSNNMKKRRLAVEAALSEFEEGIADILPNSTPFENGTQIEQIDK